MSLFAKKRPSEERASFNLAGAPGLIAANWYGLNGIGVDTALKNSATWACINVLADAIARTPFDAVRDVGGRSVPMPLQPALLKRPSGVVTRSVWKSQLAFSLVTDGNAFGQVMSTSALGYPVQLELIDPATVTNRRVVGGHAEVLWQNETRRLYPHGDLWHIPGKTVMPGSPFGLNPLEYAAKSTGTSLSAQDFSYQFFAEGTHPTAVVASKSPLTKEQAEAIKDRFNSATRGNRETVVIGSDLELVPWQMSPHETQFLDVLRFEVEQACRFWGVPPSMIYAAVSGQNVTYANVTQADLAFLKNSLDGYLDRIDDALSECLPQPQFAKADRNVILRPDPQGRMDYYAVALANRIMSVNEVRKEEDMEPFGPEFDVPGIPVIAAATPAAPARSEMHLYLPQQPDVNVLVERSDTHVTVPINNELPEMTPIIEVPAPIVNVDARQDIHVPPATPPIVEVHPADVTVNIPEQRHSRRRVVRDDVGRIVELVEQ